MKVLVLSNMYPRERYPLGGIFVHEQVKALRERGVDARVMSGEPYWVPEDRRFLLNAVQHYRNEKPTWSTWDSVPVMYFPYLVGYVFRPAIHALTYNYGLRRALSAVRKNFAYEIVHGHTSYLDGTASITASRGAIPVIITEHMGPFSVLTRTSFMRRVTRRAVRRADKVLAVSSSLKRDMIRELGIGDFIEVLGNGVDPARFSLKSECRRAINPLVKALWVGHFVDVKRLDRLIEAFERVASLVPNLQMTLLGDGEMKPAIASMITERGLHARITLRPPADRMGVAQAMRDHDFLVVSSEVETFSLVSIEALASGLPVLSTACGGPQDIVANDSLGMIVTNDIEGLAKGLREMTERIDSFEPQVLRDHAIREYSWGAIAESIITQYEALLGGQN